MNKERYKIVSIEELADMLVDRGFNESVDFTFDNVLEDYEPTGWFGVKLVDLFNEPDGCIAIGYYGGGATIARSFNPDTTMEELLKEMLWELSETDAPVECVCVDLEKNNGD